MFEHKKSLGQNFLTSDVVPKWMCDAGEIMAGETVLEIGPGTGRLTNELLARRAKVIAVEADERAVAVLAETYKNELESKQLTIHHLDIRAVDLESIGLKSHSFKVVANIPYYLSGFLFRILLENKIQPRLLIFLIQKEVAIRIARSKKESLLSLGVKAFGEASYIRSVGRGHFVPTPQVDSAIIKIDHISLNNFINIDQTLFFSILHLGFGQKRKQLLSNLTKNYERSDLEKTFLSLSLPLDVRAEDVSLDRWLLLTQKLGLIPSL